MSRSTGALAIAAFMAGFAAAWPTLHLVVVNANLASYFQENIGWHFFWTQRFVVAVPLDFVHPGQGVLFTLIQSLYLLIGKFLGFDLFGQINLFGHLTIGVAAIAMLLLVLAIAFDRELDAGVRAARSNSACDGPWGTTNILIQHLPRLSWLHKAALSFIWVAVAASPGVGRDCYVHGCC